MYLNLIVNELLISYHINLYIFDRRDVFESPVGGLWMPQLPRRVGHALLPRPPGVGILSRAQVQPGADGSNEF